MRCQDHPDQLCICSNGDIREQAMNRYKITVRRVLTEIYLIEAATLGDAEGIYLDDRPNPASIKEEDSFVQSVTKVKDE